jgi:hypothetical protein
MVIRLMLLGDGWALKLECDPTGRRRGSFGFDLRALYPSSVDTDQVPGGVDVDHIWWPRHATWSICGQGLSK